MNPRLSRSKRIHLTLLSLLAALVLAYGHAPNSVLAQVDPLPAWNEGAAKTAITPRLAVLILHDDAVREYAYGPAQGLPDTKVGTFTQALYDEAKKNGWVVVNIKNDWRRVFAFERLALHSDVRLKPDVNLQLNNVRSVRL